MIRKFVIIRSNYLLMLITEYRYIYPNNFKEINARKVTCLYILKQKKDMTSAMSSVLNKAYQ